MTNELTIETEKQVEEFISSLPPDMIQPDVYYSSDDYDDYILVKWFFGISAYSIRFEPNLMLYSLCLHGKQTNNYGHMGYCQESIDKIMLDLNRYFRKVSND